MRQDHSRRLPVLLLAGSTLLLALLAALQYSSTSRLIKSTHALQTDAVRASMEEVRSSVADLFEEAHGWFEQDRTAGSTPGSIPGRTPAATIAESVDAWNRDRPDGPIATAWMIDDGNSPSGSMSQLDTGAGEFRTVSADGIPAAVRTLMETLPERITPLTDGGVRFTDRRSWDLTEGAFIVLPIKGGKDLAFAVVGLDRRYLIDEWIPARLDEAADSFPDFHLSVADTAPAGMTPPPDVVVPLVSGTSRMYEFGAPGRETIAGAGRGAEVAVTAGVILETVPIANDLAPGERVVGPRLEARHRAGSLDAAWRSAMVRQFGLLLVIVAVVGCSIVLLVLTARRARRLADQHSAFAAGMSHELRTPVAAIGALADNLQSGVVRSENDVREYGNLIQRERRRLHDMLEGVLAWAEASSASFSGSTSDAAVRFAFGSTFGSRSKASREPVDVIHILEDEIERAREGGDADIRMNTSDAAFVVSAHESGLRLMIRNLLGNAVKHGPARGPVDVDVARTRAGTASAIRIRVRDRGPGIPEDERDLVFDPFFRGHRARTGQVPGSGLGLDLVRSIVEEFGGTVRLETPADGGACFVVDLPGEVA